MILLGIPMGPPPDPPDLDKVTKVIDRAKLQLVMDKRTVFFSALLSNLKLIVDNSHPTAATNGISMWMNPFFVMKQVTDPNLKQVDKLIGLILHEIMHVVLDHMHELYCKSIPNLRRDVLNIAQDHYINLYLTALGYVIPDGGHCDPRFRRMSSMQIYHELMKDPPPEEPDFQFDVLGAPDGMSEDEHRDQITNNLVKAVTQAQMAKAQGSIPGGLLEKLEDVLNPKLPWQVILWNYMDGYAKDDYSWRRPNRRYRPDFYLPCMYSERVSQITWGQDVSGSMTNGDLEEGFAEARYVRDIMNPERFRMMTFDVVVHMNDLLEEGEEINDAELMGGGGTVIGPLLQTIREENPLFAVIFTDGYFDEPNMDGIESDIFWVIKGNPGFRAPHGVGTVIPV